MVFAPAVSVSVLKIDSVEFVRSATGAGDLPDAGSPELSMVGRSNVGKSTLINALVKRAVARTSATPGKTRLINLYRLQTRTTGPFYLVDLPGYGFARKESRAEFDRMASAYFGRAGEVPIAVLLLVDARHPGMENDLATWQWLRRHGFVAGGANRLSPLNVVVTKIDKLTRNDRKPTIDRFEQLFEGPVLAVSAATGEGLEELWKQMTSWVVAMGASHQPCRPERRTRPTPPGPRR